ncbi:MAG: hypothetical protein KIB40_00025 [Pantoea sp.]|uniref:CII family transcriptional regulator n=1 Tax=Pantoea sp. TaxID=69393 RepID=UPI00257E5A86|nr:CII family transcriptional regulator [Pantoea sp.]MBS6031530.1 hypothetical protein [Pantoea sp.]
MEIASYRKKAREIESQLLNKLAERGQGTLAKVLDLDDALREQFQRLMHESYWINVQE